MRTTDQAIQTHEVRTINPTTVKQAQYIDVERHLLTILDALAANLDIPESASDIEACLLIAEFIKADLVDA